MSKGNNMGCNYTAFQPGKCLSVQQPCLKPQNRSFVFTCEPENMIYWLIHQHEKIYTGTASRHCLKQISKTQALYPIDLMSFSNKEVLWRSCSVFQLQEVGMCCIVRVDICCWSPLYTAFEQLSSQSHIILQSVKNCESWRQWHVLLQMSDSGGYFPCWANQIWSPAQFRISWSCYIYDIYGQTVLFYLWCVYNIKIMWQKMSEWLFKTCWDNISTTRTQSQ